MLKITIDDTPQAFRLRLEGKLCGSWVTELESCWRTGASTVQGRDLVVDLRDVTFVDAAGRDLLTLVGHAGARFVTGEPMMQALVEEITARETAPAR